MAKTPKRKTRSGDAEPVEIWLTFDGETKTATLSRMAATSVEFGAGTLTVDCRQTSERSAVKRP